MAEQAEILLRQVLVFFVLETVQGMAAGASQLTVASLGRRLDDQFLVRVEDHTRAELIQIAAARDTILVGGPLVNPLVDELRLLGRITSAAPVANGEAYIEVVPLSFGTQDSVVIAGYRAVDTDTATRAGIAWADDHLWNVDFQTRKLYQLAVVDEPMYRLSDIRRARVEYLWALNNYGPGAVRDLKVAIALPGDLPNQRLLKRLPSSSW